MNEAENTVVSSSLDDNKNNDNDNTPTTTTTSTATTSTTTSTTTVDKDGTTSTGTAVVNETDTDTDTDKNNNTTNTSNTDKTNDIQLIKDADYYYEQNAYTKSAYYIQQVSNKELLTNVHYHTLEIASKVHKILKEVNTNTSHHTNTNTNSSTASTDTKTKTNTTTKKDTTNTTGDWIKQTEIHDKNNNNFDTIIYYKVNPKTYQLTSRIESIIDSTLLISLIAVLNESELHVTWMPQFTFPFKMGIESTTKLGEYKIGNQIIQTNVSMPYPLITNRQVIFHAIACDCIDNDTNTIDSATTDHNNTIDEPCIVIALNSLDTNMKMYDITVSEPPKYYKRIDMNGGFIIKQCPKDHPLYIQRKEKLKKQATQATQATQAAQKKKKQQQPSNDTTTTTDTVTAIDNNEIDNIRQEQDDDNENDEKVLLIINILEIDSHVTFVPTKLINFVTRTVLSSLWCNLLQVALDVQNGIRTNIQQCIQTKVQLYTWVTDRVNTLLQKL